MKRFLPYILALIVLPSVFVLSCNESQRAETPCDTLSVTSGKAQQIAVSRNGRFHANFIVIEDTTGKVLAMKSKEGWQIVDCEGALEVLVADLELARQTKPK